MASEKAKSKNVAVHYVQSSVEELRKVTWPTKNQAVRMTFMVLGFCLVVALILGVLDFVFGFGYRSLLDLGPERTLPATVTEETAPLEGGEVTVGEDGAVTSNDVPEVEINLGEESAAQAEGVVVETETAVESSETPGAETSTPITE